MVPQMDTPAVMMVLQCLYKEAQRASIVAQEVMAQCPMDYEEFQQIIFYLKQQEMITNIEKNKSNGEAVYKLTRQGERLLEQKIPSQYHSSGAAKGKGGYAC
jgi:predicted transcriptional regulator